MRVIHFKHSNMTVFNNNIYLGTRNDVTGAEVWKCTICDGSDWSQVNTDGFGNINNNDARSMAVYNNSLYVGTENYVTGGEIWVYETTPVCDIQMSKTVYLTSDTVTANVFRLANPGPNPIPVEWKVWLGIPSIPPISFINIGANGTVVLPAGFDQNFGPMGLFPAAGMPVGTYEFSCRILNPVTGELLSEDLNPFTIQ